MLRKLDPLRHCFICTALIKPDDIHYCESIAVRIRNREILIKNLLSASNDTKFDTQLYNDVVSYLMPRTTVGSELKFCSRCDSTAESVAKLRFQMEGIQLALISQMKKVRKRSGKFFEVAKERAEKKLNEKAKDKANDGYNGTKSSVPSFGELADKCVCNIRLKNNMEEVFQKFQCVVRESEKNVQPLEYIPVECRVEKKIARTCTKPQYMDVESDIEIEETDPSIRPCGLDQSQKEQHVMRQFHVAYVHQSLVIAGDKGSSSSSKEKSTTFKYKNRLVRVYNNSDGSDEEIVAPNQIYVPTLSLVIGNPDRTDPPPVTILIAQPNSSRNIPPLNVLKMEINGPTLSNYELSLISFNDRNHVCQFCNFTTRKEYVFERHLWTHEKAVDAVKNCLCDTCGMSFAMEQLIPFHYRCHNSSLIKQCDVCDKYIMTHDMKSHLETHSKQVFSCSKCEWHFGKFSSYLVHLKYYHLPSPIPCYRCRPKGSVEYSKLVELAKHMVEKHKMVNILANCDEPSCSKKFLDPHVKRGHMNVHARKFQCDVCKKCFANNAARNQHRASHKEKCTKCPKTFRNGINLQSHLRAKHGLAKMKCSRCKKRFLNSFALGQHLLVRHGQGSVRELWSCSSCTKVYLKIRRRRIATHVRSHLPTW